mmetsp:Transcript_34620/g.40072  ORF Transcript_34620/g.40072 Transcript_34620/m.40072 type:complete len:164 (-) Transcript_34620:114-605(-)
MFKSKDKDANLKLIDFGLANDFLNFDESLENVKFSRMKTKAGTSFFMAPEVIKKDYSEQCDMWSAGVMLYVMLTGYPPFYGEDIDEIEEAIGEGSIEFVEDIWEDISDDAKDLISKLLVPEDIRITPKEALKHPWIQNMQVSKELPKVHINRLREFRRSSNLK